MKEKIKFKLDKVKVRNPFAELVRLKSGAGAHESKKYSRKEKHKKEILLNF